VEQDNWTSWPSREALERQGQTPARHWVGVAGRYLGLGFALWFTFVSSDLRGADELIVAGATAVGIFGFWGFVRSSPRMRVLPSVLWLVLVLNSALISLHLGGQIIAVVLLCGIAMGARRRVTASRRSS